MNAGVEIHRQIFLQHLRHVALGHQLMQIVKRAHFGTVRSATANLTAASMAGQVPAAGGASDYVWTDAGLKGGKYFYWLVEVGIGGTEGELFGPKVAVVGTKGQDMDHFTYLPLMTRR